MSATTEEKNLLKDAASFIQHEQLIALVRTSSTESAEAVIEAVVAGGIRVVEITTTVPQYVRLLESYSKRGDFLIGAGPVLNGDAALRAIEAGARFIDSSHTDKDVVAVCKNFDVTVIQGVATPTEAVEAHQMGADFVKLFPADLLGGVDTLRVWRETFPFLKLIPSGGVSLDNCSLYLKAGAAALALSGGLIDRALVRDDKWKEISERAGLFRSRLGELASRNGKS